MFDKITDGSKVRGTLFIGGSVVGIVTRNNWNKYVVVAKKILHFSEFKKIEVLELGKRD